MLDMSLLLNIEGDGQQSVSTKVAVAKVLKDEPLANREPMHTGSIDIWQWLRVR